MQVHFDRVEFYNSELLESSRIIDVGQTFNLVLDFGEFKVFNSTIRNSQLILVKDKQSELILVNLQEFEVKKSILMSSQLIQKSS